jgi:type 1 glutamine amidotransferase
MKNKPPTHQENGRKIQVLTSECHPCCFRALVVNLNLNSFTRVFWTVETFLLVLFCLSAHSHSDERSTVTSATPKLRLLIVTGGHDFEEAPFFQMFKEMEGTSWTHAAFGGAAEQMLRPEKSGDYDVAVFYDMHQNPEPHSRNWLKLLEQGKPTVFLHHALGSYVNWEHYGEIVGGRANFGRQHVEWTPNTTFLHDVTFRVHIADPNHPITKGLADFEIFDETYNHFAVNPDVHVLLTTDHPTSEKTIAWTHRYKRSPIVYLQLGHGPSAYNNPKFRTLLARSIRWAAGQLGK